MLNVENDELYFQNVQQSNSLNLHILKFKLRDCLLLLTLDGYVYYFSCHKADNILSNRVHLNDLLKDRPTQNSADCVNVISSAVSEELEYHNLVVCCQISNAYCLLLVEITGDFLNMFTYRSQTNLDYCPCLIKNLHTNRNYNSFVISGSNELVYGYRVDKKDDSAKICNFNIAESIPVLTSKPEGVVLCVDVLILENSIRLIIGCDSGIVAVWKFSSSFNDFLCKIEKKFDSPISVARFFARENGPYVIVASALGPAILYSLADDAFLEYVKFPKTDKCDVLITCYMEAESIGKSEVCFAFGTFGYDLLIYAANFESKICSLTAAKKYLSPVIGLINFMNYFVVLTCTGIYFYVN